MRGLLARFDFKRLGRACLIGVFVLGAFLSRHAAGCFFDAVASFDLGGVVDDGTNTGIVGEGGMVDDGIEGDYAENFKHGAGFFGHMAGSAHYCVAENSFSDPLLARQIFWVLLSLFGVCWLMDRYGPADWKDDIRDRGAKADLLSSSNLPVIEPRRPQKKVVPIDVDFGPEEKTSPPLHSSFVSKSVAPSGPGIRSRPSLGPVRDDPFGAGAERFTGEHVRLPSRTSMEMLSYRDNEETSAKQLSDNWSPPGWSGDVLFVAPEGSRRGVFQGESEETPICGLGNALARARAIGGQVQLRLLPGIYAEQVRVSEDVALINHSLPANRGLGNTRLRELLNRGDSKTSVTLTMPPGASGGSVVTLERADNTWLVGLRFVGGVSQDPAEPSKFFRALKVSKSNNVRVLLSTFHAHGAMESGGAVKIVSSGEARQRVALEQCLFEENFTRGRGGAVSIEDSVVVLRECMVRANSAGTSGGGVAIENAMSGVLFEDSVICDNRVEVTEDLPDVSRAGWSGHVGHGGGLFVSTSAVNLRHTDVVANDARGSGGGLFVSSSVLSLEGNDGSEARPGGLIANNMAGRGGGVLLTSVTFDGRPPLQTTFRAKHVEFVENQANLSGGGIAAFRLIQLELDQCSVARNLVLDEHGEGGGLHIRAGSRLKLRASTIAQNAAQRRGGGLSICNSSLRVFEGCRVSENRVPAGKYAGLLFYTQTSSLLDTLKATGELESPMVCALAPCEITQNVSSVGTGGVLIGNLEEGETAPIVFTIKEPSRLTENSSMSPTAPQNLAVLWQEQLVASCENPPTGKWSLPPTSS